MNDRPRVDSAHAATGGERESTGRWARLAPVALLVLAAIVAALIFSDFGVTWDEGVQSTYGELVLDYFASGGRDTRCNEYSNLFYYGPLFESAAAAAYRTVGAWKYEIRHAAIGLAALGTLAAVWRFGRLFGSGAVPFFAVLSLMMMPRFVGHAFNNSKDIPLACAFAWAMLTIGRLLTGRRWRWPEVVGCGIAIGVALSMRIGAIVLLAILAAGMTAAYLLRREERQRWRDRALGRTLKLAGLLTMAWSIMVVVWPWAHGGPFTRPLAALSEMSGFTFAYTTYFAGELVRSDQLPWYYLPTYLSIVTPLTVLVLTLLGMVVSARQVMRQPRDTATILPLVLYLWLLIPIVYVIVARPNTYDGIRHFLFLLPAMALFCGLGVRWVLLRRKGGSRVVAAIVLLAALLVPLRDLVLLHPYQSSYFNALVGGVGSAWRRFDTDYWASSYREAMHWVLGEIARTGAGPTAILVACNHVNRPCAEAYLPASREEGGAGPDVTIHCLWEGGERLPAGARYYVAMLRYGKAFNFLPDWPVVHNVGRQGALFSVIKRSPQAGVPPRDAPRRPRDRLNDSDASVR